MLNSSEKKTKDYQRPTSAYKSKHSQTHVNKIVKYGNFMSQPAWNLRGEIHTS